MFEKRKLTKIHYAILVMILAIAAWLNFRLIFINATECSSSIPCICTEILSYKISRYLAYASLLLMGLFAIYLFVIHEGKKLIEPQTNVVIKAVKSHKPILKRQDKNEKVVSPKPVVKEIVEVKKEPVPVEVYTAPLSNAVLVNDKDIEIVELKKDNSPETKAKSIVIPPKAKKEPKVSESDTKSWYKKDIADYIFNTTDLTLNKALKFLNILIEDISYNLLEGEKVTIEGLGTFKKYKVEEYTGTNPKTKKEYLIESNNRIKYIPDPVLEKHLNDKRRP